MTRSRHVPLALTVGGGIGVWPVTEGGIRTPFAHAVSVPRWRVHFRNINPREGHPGAGRFVLSNVAIGPSDHKGGWSSPPSIIAPHLAAANADVTTPWMDWPLVAGTEYLLAYSWSATRQTKRVIGGGWTTPDHLDEGALLVPTQTHPIDAWIEAVVPATTPVIAVFGDSLSSGVLATAPVRDSWPSIYARMIGGLPVHYTASGDTMVGWMRPDHYKWSRWLHLGRPDRVIHAMGSNDITNGRQSWELQKAHLETSRIIRAKLSREIHVATITPISDASEERQQVRRSHNAWLRDRFTDVVPLHMAVSADDTHLARTVDVDGTHMNTLGYERMARAVAEALA